MGWRASRADGTPLDEIHPAAWSDLAHLSPGASSFPLIRIACDIANPLLGPHGAATVFGPQKGLHPADLPALESATGRIANLIGTAVGSPGLGSTPGAGAAGGIAFGFLTAAAAKLVPGFDLVEEWLDLAPKFAAAYLVITGAGCFDLSSLEGKGPGALALRAVAQKKTVWIFSGAVRLDTPPVGCEITAITPPLTPLSLALAQSADNLKSARQNRVA